MNDQMPGDKASNAQIRIVMPLGGTLPTEASRGSREAAHEGQLVNQSMMNKHQHHLTDTLRTT